MDTYRSSHCHSAAVKRLAASIMYVAALFATDARAEAEYKIEQIGLNIMPHGINSNGEIVGSRNNLLVPYEGNNFRGNTRAVHRSAAGTWRLLFSKNVESVAYSIDDFGNISGTIIEKPHEYYSSSGFMRTPSGFLYTMPKAGALSSTQNAGWKVKDGVVFGTTSLKVGQVGVTWNPEMGSIVYYRGPYWGDDRTMAYLGATGLSGNRAGRIVGSRTTGGILAGRPASWEANELTCSDGELGTCSLPQTFAGNVILGVAKDANDRGQIVGYENDVLDTHITRGVLWEGFGDSFSVTNLGSLGDGAVYPWAIDSTGNIVGESACSAYWEGCAFYWTKTRGMINLNDVTVTNGYHIVRATSMNDSGQIVGVAVKESASYGVLLTPIHATENRN